MAICYSPRGTVAVDQGNYTGGDTLVFDVSSSAVFPGVHETQLSQRMSEK